jgi:hypothetical protein
MRKAVSLLAAAAAVLALAAPAQAMGSGNPYEDMQAGVTYTVYSPTYTAGLNVVRAGGNAATAPGIEQNVFALYGKRNGRNISLYEGNPLGSDPGMGKVVMRTTVQGQPATVTAFCDPANASQWARCKASDVNKVGGYLKVTLPAAKGLRPTVVIVETDGPFPVAAQQLVQFAKGLQPLTS